MSNRAEQLAQKALDNGLSQKEEEELAFLLGNDDVDSKEALELLHAEAMLRGMLSDMDVSDSVMAEVQRPQPKRRRSAIPVVLTAAAAFAVVCGLWLAFMPGGVGDVEVVKGTAQIKRGEQTIEVKDFVRLEEGDVVETADSPAVLSLRDGSVVNLAAQGSLRVQRESGWALRLDSGQASFRIARQSKSFNVATPAMAIQVLGTQFSVTHRDKVTAVTVAKGHVQARNTGSGKPFDLYKGGFLTATADRVLGCSELKKTMDLDFEGGTIPPSFRFVELIAGETAPPGNHTRYCIRALPGAPNKVLGPTVEDIKIGLFAYDDQLVIRFRYWMTPQCHWLGVWMRSDSANLNLYNSPGRPTFNRWVEVEVPLNTLRTQDRKRAMENGGIIHRLQIQAGRTPGARFYVDDIRIERH